MNSKYITFGTSYFQDLKSIYTYYGNEKFNIDAINKKISTKECHVGKPKINNRQKLILENGRYYIKEFIICNAKLFFNRL